MDIPAEALRRIENDHVAWLTTVTPAGNPLPTPVWFAKSGDGLVVYSAPDTHKVRNIAAHPRVTLHFNSDAQGGDIVVITADAAIEHGRAPSQEPGYSEKYEEDVTGILNLTNEAFDATYSTRLLLRPVRVRADQAD